MNAARLKISGGRVAELEQHLAAQSKEAEILGRRAQDLETRLGEQSRLLNQSEFELKHVRQEMDAARQVESELRTTIIELEGRASSASQNLRNENTQLQATIAHIKEERDRFARELATMKRETEEAWASERVENALLRERINDVAAEVARLASALEGPNSPIESLLAAETSHEQITSVPLSGRTARSRRVAEQRQSCRSHSCTADPRFPAGAGDRRKTRN